MKQLKINYRTEAIRELLNTDCVLERYDRLVPCKDDLADFYLSKGCFTKEQCLRLPDDAVLQSGLLDQAGLNLFKRFLSLYDIDPAKLREIDRLALSAQEAAAYAELYLLPGVKRVRASLYYMSGIRSLRQIADLTPQDMIGRTTQAIKKYLLDCKAPLLKEARTHIAVAKAFTTYSAD